ncbi:hypothetical protein HD806DRAFT_515890 [Xylariaceae sp. AK1471]|nr:hypothetical protein HD806DRAFT_515890 [Xylariaceae sp. AK1471]
MATMMQSTPTPVLPPPPGVTSNFDHPETLRQINNIAIGISIPVSTVFYSLRLYTRIWIRRSWIFEDSLATVAFLGTVSFCGLCAAYIDHYGGRHEWDITPAEAHQAAYWFNVGSIHYGVIICIAKVTILWMYRRIFSPIRWRVFDLIIVFLITLLSLFYTASNIAKIWECIPRAKIFDPTIPGHCIDIGTLINVSGLFNTVTDFIILVLPVKAVWKMNMSLQKKVKIVFVFTFGLSAPIFSAIGVYVRVRGSSSPDKTWVSPAIQQFSLAELTVAVLCISFPELGPIWGQNRQRISPSQSDTNGSRIKHMSLRNRSKNDPSRTANSLTANGLEYGPYIELAENPSFHVQAAVNSVEPGPLCVSQEGAITVTKEIRVHSSRKN